MTPTETSPLDQWKSYSAQLPDMPDSAFDAQRQKFFRENVMPWAMQRGYSPDLTHQVFMENSERPGKSATPRLDLALSSMIRTAGQPAIGLTGAAEQAMNPSFNPKEAMKTLDVEQQKATQEAQRQGVGTTLPTLAGEAAGFTPFIMGGEAAAGAAGLTGAAARIAGFAAAQATMDSAKAEDGQRLIKGIEGGIEGAALGGLFEGAKLIPGLLRGSATATAVDKVVKGVATPEQAELAKAVEVVDPKAGDEIVKQAAKDSAAATSLGVPKNPPRVDPDVPAAKITLRRKDGSVYEIPDSPDLQQRLAGGESIESIIGSSKDVHKVTKNLDAVNGKAGKYDVKIPPERPSIPVITKAATPSKLAAADEENFQLLRSRAERGRPIDLDSLRQDFKIGKDRAQALLDRFKKEGTGSLQVVTPDVTPTAEVPPTPIKNRATVDAFEVKAAPPEAEAIPVVSSASTFDQWSQDSFEKTLQQKVLDTSIPLSARDAAYSRLKKLNPQSAESIDNFLEGASKEEVASTSAPNPELEKKVSPLIPIYKAQSARGEVSIQSIATKMQMPWKDAEELVRQGIDQQILTPSRVLTKGVEDIQFYKVKPRKIGIDDIPEAGGVKFQAPNVDDGLKRLRDRIKEKYGEPPSEPAEPEVDPNAPSELELQLRASLDKLGVKYQAPLDHVLFGQLSQGQFVQEALDTQTFESAQEAARYYQSNVRQWQTGAPGQAAVRPMYNTATDSGSILPEGASAATFPAIPGSKAGVVFSGAVPRSTIYHEGTHALLSTAGVSGDVAELFGDDFAKKLFNGAFEGDAGDFYKTHTPEAIPEETFVWMAQAYRHGDNRLLQSFIDADGSEAELASWYSGKVNELLGRTNALEDSLYKRRLQTRLRDLVNRSGGSLQEMSAESSIFGKQVDHIDGQYALRGEDGTIEYFDSREALADHLHDNYSTPMISPEFVDLSALAEGTPLYQANRPPGSRQAIGGTPAPPELLPGKDINAGMHVLSYYFRPFYAWVDSVSEKFKWPELSQRMTAIQDAQIGMNNAMRPYLDVLKDTIGKVPHARQDLLFKLVEAAPQNRADIAQSLKLTQSEIDAVTGFNEKFVNPLEGELGNISLEHFIRKYHGPGQRDLSSISTEAISNRAASGELKFLGESYRTGDLDPRDQDLLNIASEYLRAGMRKKHLESPLQEAAKLVNLSANDKTYVAGNLQPLLARHLNYLRGVPDYGTRIIHEGIQTSMNIINEGIDAVNKKLPDSWKMDSLEDPKTALQKWITYNYAGGLMLRVMVPLRDSLQYFLTTYPMLGGKYSMKGIQIMMEGREGEDIRAIAKQYGALLEDRDILNYVRGEDTGPGKGAMDRFVDRGMWVMQFSNNSNRLAAFWGHTQRVLDTFDELKVDGITDRKVFAEKAGMNYLSKVKMNRYLDELLVTTPERRADYAYRVAKDLVDVSQWGVSPGAAPGFYKYGLGKLFGQYGTWPLNYLEFARKMTGLGDSSLSSMEKVHSLTRLALAHYAILKAGDMMGVDTGSWVFTQPIAYSGGPMFTAATSLPQSLDFESQKGQEARRNVVRPIYPMSIPGGLFASKVLDALRKDDPDFWKIFLGFQPMKHGEYEKGLHLIPPDFGDNFR